MEVYSLEISDTEHDVEEMDISAGSGMFQNNNILVEGRDLDQLDIKRVCVSLKRPLIHYCFRSL